MGFCECVFESDRRADAASFKSDFTDTSIQSSNPVYCWDDASVVEVIDVVFDLISALMTVSYSISVFNLKSARSSLLHWPLIESHLDSSKVLHSSKLTQTLHRRSSLHCHSGISTNSFIQASIVSSRTV